MRITGKRKMPPRSQSSASGKSKITITIITAKRRNVNRSSVIYAEPAVKYIDVIRIMPPEELAAVLVNFRHIASESGDIKRVAEFLREEVRI